MSILLKNSVFTAAAFGVGCLICAPFIGGRAAFVCWVVECIAIACLTFNLWMDGVGSGRL